jgi:tungstate transport system substrate-binding protein
MSNFARRLLLLIIALVLITGCADFGPPPAVPQAAEEPEILRLATTTSTADSGLLDAIVPEFESEYNADVDVVAVGTGQALTIGSSGDADVVLVHARAREDQFVAEGHAPARYDVMYNDFVVVGPPDDPADIRGSESAATALREIAAAGAAFASRGDDSGTHTKERNLWSNAGIEPTADDEWYNSLGQGMGNTLIFANEQEAYTTTDRGTFLSMREQLPDLEVLVGGASIANNPDPELYNPYGVMPVDPETHPGVNYDLAMQFVEWLISVPVQEEIAEYGRDTFDQPLFYPNSDVYREANNR